MSINRKFVILLTSSVLIISLVSLYLHYRMMIRAEIEDMESLVSTAGPLVEQGLRDSMLRRDLDALDRTISNFSQIKPITNLFITDKEGIIREGSDRRRLSTRPEFINSEWLSNSESRSSFFVRDQETFRWVRPVKNAEECHGCHGKSSRYNGLIVIGFSVSEMTGSMKRHVWQELYLLVGALTLFSLFLFLFSRRLVTRRLSTVVTAHDEFEKGNYEKRLTIEGGDEITSLEKSFNRMANAIASRDEFLRSERDYSRGIVDSLPGIFYLFTEQARMLQWNKALEDISGYSTDEISKLAPLDFIAERDRPFITNKIQEVFTKGSADAEAHFLCKNGDEVSFYFTGVRLETEHGPSVIGVGMDISERSKFIARLEESERKFRALFDYAHDGILVADAENKKFIVFNNKICDMLGYTHEEMPSLGVQDIHPADSLPYIGSKFQEILDKKTTFTADLPVMRKDGNVFYADISASPVILEGRLCAVGIFRDITERRRIERDLRDSEKRYHTLFEAARDAIFILDAEGENAGLIVDANLAAAQMHGYTLDELLGMKIMELDAPEAAAESASFIERILKREWIRKEIDHKRKDGSLFPVEISAGLLEINGHNYVLAIDRDVTDRKIAEAKLKAALELAENEQRKVTDILEAIDEAISIQDTDYRIIYQNAAHQRLMGDCKGQFCYIAYEKNSQICEGCGIRQVFADGKPHTIIRSAHIEGRGTAFAEITSSPLRDRTGKIIAGIEVARDITERRKSELRIAEHVLRLQKLAEMSMKIAGDPVNVFGSIAGTIAELINVPVVCLSEISGNELRFLSVYNRGNIATDAGGCALEVTPCATVQRNKDILVYHDVAAKFPEAQLLKENNIVSYCGFPAVDSTGKVIAVTCLLDDKHHEFTEEDKDLLRIIAQRIGTEMERKRLSESRMQVEEEKQRVYDTQIVVSSVLQLSLNNLPIEQILQQALDLILSVKWLAFEPKGGISLAADDTRRLVMKAQRGLSEHVQKECASTPFGKCLCGRAAETQEVQFMGSLDERHEVRFDGIKPHGHYCVPILSSGKTLGVINIYLSDGHKWQQEEVDFLNAIANVLSGIIQRKQLEKERERLIDDLQLTLDRISQSQKEWRETFDSITDLVSIHDNDFNIVKANKAFAGHFGLSPKDVLGRKCYRIFHDCDMPVPNCPHRQTVGDRRPHTEEIVDPSTKRTFLESTFPYSSPDGEIAGSIHIARDVTDEKEKEMRLIMSERLASLGQMASGIAHEINNPLASIAGCTEGLLKRVSQGRFEPELFSDYLKIIQEEIVRCKNITSGMLSFVRKSTYDARAIDIQQTIDKTLDIIGFQGRLKDVSIIKKYADTLPQIRGSEGELRQALLAIISNALDAIDNRGELTLETGIADEGIFVTIKDTGPGILPEHISRIFDPFFTTKGETGGTGLGLSIANKIIINHRGRIDVSSAPGEGATFKIFLPF